MDRLKIVLGLGNPGARYRGTRHNLGFRVVERLASGSGADFSMEQGLERVVRTARVRIGGTDLVLAKPRTYMNRSGIAAARLCLQHVALPHQMLVIYDDADLELGRLRIRGAGSAGGHNGLGSVIDALRTDEIPRLRLGVRGINRGDGELSDYVLAPFEPDEESVAEALIDLGVEAVRGIIELGLPEAMNRYNSQRVTPREPEGSPEQAW